ncbi:MAG: hypothetical protein U1F53_10980 [Burkholderiaceae bacterium]
MNDGVHRIASPSGLAASFNDNGSLRELRYGADLCLHLFPGNTLEAGSTQLVLRRWDGPAAAGAPDRVLPLLGPHSPARWFAGGDRCVARGEWDGLAFELSLVLAAGAPVWFWHLGLQHARGTGPVTVDLLLQHDLALAPHGALRLNEYYVSHYIDFTALAHERHGSLLAVRQNQAAAGHHPSALLGSLRRAVSWATDAAQVLGAGHRFDEPPQAWRQGLPGRRLQQEQAMAALQDAPLTLAVGERATLGFFGGLQPDHPAASGPADLAQADAWLALPEATPPAGPPPAALHAAWQAPLPSLFSHAPRLAARALGDAECDALFGPRRHHEERGPDGRLWSFFSDAGEHVVLPAKERAVLRPHGHLLRSGQHLVPDESAMTSTCWMAGVFHSMVTQGHVSMNRCLSTVHGQLGQFRSQGQRVFVQRAGRWQLLDQPSAFAMSERGARWWYRDDAGLIELQAEADAVAPVLSLSIRFAEGPAGDCLVSHHLALGGDDGEQPGRIAAQAHPGGGWWLAPPAGSALHQRFPRAASWSSRWTRPPGSRPRTAPRPCSTTGRTTACPCCACGWPPRRCWACACRATWSSRCPPPRRTCPRCSRRGWPPPGPTPRPCPRPCPGSSTTPWCTTWPRAGWSSTRAAAGARATSARARSSCCWPRARWPRCATC